MCLAIATPTLEAAGFDTTTPAGLMAFVGQVQKHETDQATAAAGGGGAAAAEAAGSFAAGVARIRGLLMPPTMAVPDGMAAKRAALDAKMKKRQQEREAKAAARRAAQQNS